ncbi:MAG: zinc-ribbon domain-containing protein [Bacteroidales bacterium]|nr:zinc-ribbon domain-containing protein [Bacteroidales bacterium]
MKFCKNCGEEIQDDSKFCHKCGTPLSEAENTQPENSPIEKKIIKISVITLILLIVCFIFFSREKIFTFFDENSSQEDVLTEEEQVKKAFDNWIEEQIMEGNITRESIEGDDGGITEYGYADVNEDGRIDGLFGVCFYTGGNHIPCSYYYVGTQDVGVYAVVELNERSKENLHQLQDCFSYSNVSFSFPYEGGIQGTFYGYLEDDDRYSPSVKENFTWEFEDRIINSIGGKPFDSKIAEYSLYKVTGTYTGTLKQYMIDLNGNLKFFSDFDDIAITVKYEDNNLFLYENENKRIQCVKMANASNGYVVALKYLNNEDYNVILGYSNIDFDNAKYHGCINTETNKLVYRALVNLENLSVLNNLKGPFTISEIVQTLTEMNMRGIVLQYDLKKKNGVF